jgi:uncharacterized membrane protein YgcG
VKILLCVFKKYYFINHTKTISCISVSGSSSGSCGGGVSSGGGGGGGKLVQVIG